MISFLEARVNLDAVIDELSVEFDDLIITGSAHRFLNEQPMVSFEAKKKYDSTSAKVKFSFQCDMEAFEENKMHDVKEKLRITLLSLKKLWK